MGSGDGKLREADLTPGGSQAKRLFPHRLACSSESILFHSHPASGCQERFSGLELGMLPTVLPSRAPSFRLSRGLENTSSWGWAQESWTGNPSWVLTALWSPFSDHSHSDHVPWSRRHARTEGPCFAEADCVLQSASSAGSAMWGPHPPGPWPPWCSDTPIPTIFLLPPRTLLKSHGLHLLGSGLLSSQLRCWSADCSTHPTPGWPHRGGQGTLRDWLAQTTTVRKCELH